MRGDTPTCPVIQTKANLDPLGYFETGVTCGGAASFCTHFFNL